jgi:ubiquinone biosynthesis protein
MSWGDFVRLFRMLFGSRQPDLDEIQKMGLLAVKIGQVFALRIDFLGVEKCRELSGLYSRQNKLQPQEFQGLIAQNGGDELLAKFGSFDRNPFAVASIGQCHRAKLKSGRDVVVKFVKGDLRPSFERDIARAEFLLRIAQHVYPKLRGVANPLSLIHELREMTLNELDLHNEAKGHDLLQQCYLQSYPGYDLSKLGFAILHRELSTETVLVKDYVSGRTFDELLSEGTLSYSTLLDLFRIHGFYMFVKGTFHGDIHPGNVILSGNKIYFIDTGFIGKVTDRIRVNLFHFFDELSQYRYAASAHYLHAMSSITIERKAYAAFERKFVSLYSDFTGMPVGKVSLTRKMMDTIKLGVRSGMEFEEGMFDIIKSLMYMDGMVLRANPDAILLEDLRPFIQEFRAHIA